MGVIWNIPVRTRRRTRTRTQGGKSLLFSQPKMKSESPKNRNFLYCGPCRAVSFVEGGAGGAHNESIPLHTQDAHESPHNNGRYYFGCPFVLEALKKRCFHHHSLSQAAILFLFCLFSAVRLSPYCRRISRRREKASVPPPFSCKWGQLFSCRRAGRSGAKV